MLAPVPGPCGLSLPSEGLDNAERAPASTVRRSSYRLGQRPSCRLLARQLLQSCSRNLLYLRWWASRSAIHWPGGHPIEA